MTQLYLARSIRLRMTSTLSATRLWTMRSADSMTVVAGVLRKEGDAYQLQIAVDDEVVYAMRHRAYGPVREESEQYRLVMARKGYVEQR